MDKILHGDSLELLKHLDDNSVDSVVTDPPYGYSFMGKDWDKALPDIKIWKECVRVLKPGGFAFIMTAPRSDVHSRMCLMLEEAGFRIDFTPIAWTYATGFPKAMNIGKMVDKRLGVEREKTGEVKVHAQKGVAVAEERTAIGAGAFGEKREEELTKATSDKAKELDGSYAGYQPKPAWENVIVCMKPLSEKGYLDQAMKNQKGITWLDDCRIPFQGQNDAVQYEKDNVAGMMNFDGKYEKGSGKNYEGGWEKPNRVKRFKKKSDYEKYVEKQKSFKGSGDGGFGSSDNVYGDGKAENPSETYQKPKTTKRKPREEGTVFKTSGFKSENNDTAEASPFGRFAANLLVQDDVLNDGKITKACPTKRNRTHTSPLFGMPNDNTPEYDDEGSFSRYYDLDAWWEERIKELPLNVQTTYPFMIVPKASKSEKNKGLDNMDKKVANSNYGKGGFSRPKEGEEREIAPTANFHPTVKPISLMSYLITMGSRENDLVLDPFVGSGTTCIAAKLLNRKYLGMEMDDEYVVIAKARIKAHKSKKQKHSFF